MKKPQLLGLLFCLTFISCRKVEILGPLDGSVIGNESIAGSGTSSFQRIIGGAKLDVFYSVKQTSDGGYLLCGMTENESASQRDILLYKTNPKGEFVWSKKFSGNFEDTGWFIENTTDGGYVIAAQTSNASNYQDNIGQLLKVDGQGNLLWEKSFSQIANYFLAVRQTSDGGFAACGNDLGGNGILLKTDATGNELWHKTFVGISDIDQMNTTHDGGLILCGNVRSSSTSPTDVYVIRTNAAGDTLWTRTYGDAYDNSASSIMETVNGDFILCGYNANTSTGASGFAQLLDSIGMQKWYSDFGSLDIDALDFIIPTNDNQYVAVGRESFGSPSKSYLQKIEANGQNAWIKTFAPGDFNMLLEVQHTTDNGFVMAGYTFNGENGNGYLVKTDVDGN